MGDFNEITCQSDKLEGNRIQQYKADKFVDAMNECGLIDAGSIGSRFTWFNKQKDNPIYQKLDRAWLNMHWLNLFPNSTVHNLPRGTSDHNPIKLSTEQKERRVTPSQPNFKLEPLWYAEPGFSKMVDEKLNAECSNFVTKLNNISKTMSAWAKDNIGNFLKKGKFLSARLSGTKKPWKPGQTTCIYWK
ncbi:uncharacterized protein [Spinacia oleracea]|uniref:Endonuclease/exonuclease/phosphatase domain-containing protein n=1 Tax=Spinacia oleracea TaxID=3562 RepID=A0A9R0IT04_SPIOL|nr:uncharacterized protein LOC110794390 [Spinacia oleracea]